MVIGGIFDTAHKKRFGGHNDCFIAGDVGDVDDAARCNERVKPANREREIATALCVCLKSHFINGESDFFDRVHFMDTHTHTYTLIHTHTH